MIEKIRAAVRDAMSRGAVESKNPSPPAPLPEAGRGEEQRCVDGFFVANPDATVTMTFVVPRKSY